MKQVNFLMVALLIMMSTAITSCMNGNNESSFDSLTYVTVQDGMYGVVLTTDDGFRLIPTNPEVLKTSIGEYVKRAHIALKWVEGVVFDGDRSKSYKMTIVQVAGVPTEKYCDRLDTLENSYPIAQLAEFVWGANGEYLNVPFSFNYNANKPFSFVLYPVKAEGDELVMKLVQSVGSEDGYEQSHFISFELPTVSEINYLLEEFIDREDVEGGVLDFSNDSINVKVIADGRYEEVLESKFAKIKIRNY